MPVAVFQAETGALLPLRMLAPGDTLDTLRAEIEATSHVPANAQILLASTGMQVKQGMLAEWLAAPGAADERIFLFNRLELDPRNVEAPVHMSIDIEPPVPSDGDRVESYAQVFRLHAEYGEALLKIANKHATTSVMDAFDSYYAHAQKEFVKHSGLLHSFPVDLQTLKHIPIHGAITTESKFLDDFVPKTKLYAWVDYCRMAHDDLVSKTTQLAETIAELRLSNPIEGLDAADYE
nr:hypothetical protein HK105_001891 [Polyrhizophydium stewartii]